MDNVDKLHQTMVRGVIAFAIFLIGAVALDAAHEDRQLSKCIENGNSPIECSMAFDSFDDNKIILQAIKKLQAERE